MEKWHFFSNICVYFVLGYPPSLGLKKGGGVDFFFLLEPLFSYLFILFFFAATAAAAAAAIACFWSVLVSALLACVCALRVFMRCFALPLPLLGLAWLGVALHCVACVRCVLGRAGAGAGGRGELCV